jgi:hypothetical protein
MSEIKEHGGLWTNGGHYDVISNYGNALHRSSRVRVFVTVFFVP